MEELLAKKEALKTRESELHDEVSKVSQELFEVNEAITKIELTELTEEYKSFLSFRLELLKSYLTTAVKMNPATHLTYTIEKMKERPTDDWHEPQMDYVPWKIEDFELIRLTYEVKVTFEIYAPAVKQFVMDWIAEHVPNMHQAGFF